ncbi:MAG: four helix bundle protein [Spirochaetia bacterium]|nr:MAG: four helix bundle protein [Spirochaetia bacterium]
MEIFRNLIAWQKTHQLVIEVYKLVKTFPEKEKFILIPQILRATISIAANLAEGTKRRTVKDRRHFFNMAETSLEEVKYYIILSADLDYIPKDKENYLFDISREIGRLINGLINKT